MTQHCLCMIQRAVYSCQLNGVLFVAHVYVPALSLGNFVYIYIYIYILTVLRGVCSWRVKRQRWKSEQ